MKSVVRQAFDMLGMRVQDRITKFEGIVDSVCFDLYGCAQIAINPGIDKDGKKKDSYWFDVKRVQIIPGVMRVMEAPAYLDIEAGKEIGAADKPTQRV